MKMRVEGWIFAAVAALFYIGILWCMKDEKGRPASKKAEDSPVNAAVAESKAPGQPVTLKVSDSNGVAHNVTLQSKTVVSPTPADMRSVPPLSSGGKAAQKMASATEASNSSLAANAEPGQPVSFKRDVMPILMKAGCNTGACHGSARGKDGFHLSLFGYDPDGDYFRLTREVSGRRVNLALPEESLMLQKATGSVAHTGGKRFEKGSEFYNTLLHWIQQGAPHDPDGVPTVTGVELTPKQIVMEGEHSTQQLIVQARYSDGSVRDVTRLAVFLSNNESSAKVDPNGAITAGQRGEAFVMARFATSTVGSDVIVIPKDLKFQFPAVAESNYIDKAVDDKLRKLRIAPSNVCTDEEFLRRVTIDIVGLLPTVADHDRFMADTSPNKRAKLIDELLARPEFTDIWVMKLAEMLQIRSVNEGGNDVSYKSTILYFNWLRDQVSAGVPLNEIIRKIVSATGGTFVIPAANYYEEEVDPLKLAENCAQSFLGIRMQCAQCHNHPFDRWTMNDYRGFVGFFSQVGRKKAEDPRETIVFNSGEGESKHPVTNQTVPPKFLGGAAPDTKGKDRREVLADWLASPDNPWVTKHFANVIWAQFLGRGIIEPVDDVRVSNPPANEELLDELAAKLVDYHYDFRRLIRDICNSRTYQLSSVANATNEGDDRNFSHAAVRRLRAEVMLDCLSEVTDTRDKFRGLPIGGRAVQIADGHESSYFLKTFGRASRDTVCTCEVAMDPNLSQALDLLNGDTVQHKIRQGAVVEKDLGAQKPTPEIVNDLYLRCFGRKPTPEEMKSLSPMVGMSSMGSHSLTTAAPLVTANASNAPQSAPDNQKQLEDLFWALLNSKEFMFNH